MLILTYYLRFFIAINNLFRSMKRYITSVICLILIAAFFISFRSTDGKLGPRLNAVMDNTTQQTFIVYIYFNDKGPDALAMLNNPLSLVTQRSIDRRLKVKTQESVVDYHDIPLYHGYVESLVDKVINLRQQIKWFNCVSAEVTRQQIEDLTKLGYINRIELVESFVKRKNDSELTQQDNNTAPSV